MKKKAVAVLLAAAMTAAATGCGSSSQDSGSTSESSTSESSSGSSTSESSTSASSADDSSNATADADGAPVNEDGSKLMEGVTLVMSSDNYRPYRYQDESGQWIGYDFAVMDALSEILGFTYTFEEMEFSGVVTSLTSGHSDVAPTLCATEERLEVLDFTEPYHIPKPLFAVAEDSDIESVEDLVGKNVAVTFGTTWETMLYDELPEANVTAMDTLTSVVADVVAGRQDALFGDSVQIAEYAEANGLRTIEWDTDYTIPADDFGFIKGSEYVEPFNLGLQYLKSTGELAALQEEWLGAESVTDWSTVTVTQ